MRYLDDAYGTPPFPADPDRALALKRMAIDGAHAGCSGENYNMCYVLSDVSTPFPGQPETGPYSATGRMQAYLNYTETGCANGDPAACYWRSAAFPRYKPEVVAVGIALEMAKGQTQRQAAQTIAQQTAAYKQQILPAARTKAASLRPACSGGDAVACADLGELLHDFDEVRTTEFEHIALLYDACAPQTPAACFSLDKAIGRLARTRPSRATEAPVRDTWINALRATCDTGNAAHCQVLVDLAGSNDALDKSALQSTACQAGSAKSCTSMARSHLRDYEKSEAPEDLQTAVNLLTRACTLKDNQACHMLEHLSKG